MHFNIMQNARLNDVNDKLIQANQRLREYLEQINTNYAELAKVVEEVEIRRKLAQEKNEEITKLNQEIQEKLQVMETEYPRLQRISQAMDVLTMLAEATRHI